MKAIVYERYGPPNVLQIRDVPKPVPNDTDLLIKIHATTVRAGDWRMRKPAPATARLFNGLFRPRRRKILGMELAGEVEATGDRVARFTAGDRVFASTGLRFGAYAEYTCLSEDAVVAHMPDSLKFEQAAAAPSGGLAALSLLRKAGIEDREKVLIYGASGSVGSFAVQLAKHFRTNATAVCSTPNLEWVKTLGADHVIDYTKQEFAEYEERYDLIFDAVGKMMTGLPRSHFKKLLAPGGVVVSIEQNYKERQEDLETLAQRMAEGAVRSVIDRRYSLEEIVDAHRYVEAGHKKGNVVVLIEEAS